MIYTKEHIAEIKQISIVEYLAHGGIIPQKENGHEAWYRSPLREEKTSSFKVDKAKNMYYDFGTSKYGDIIALVMELQGLDFKEAISYLSNGKFEKIESNPFSFDCQRSNKPETQITKVKSLENKALIDYLSTRNIPYSIGKQYLKEVYHKVHKKRYFALAFQNNSKGFAIRNKYFKGNLNANDCTLIQGQSHKDLSVFEGFMDFLSYLVHFSKEVPKYDTLVLNSLSHLPKATDLFQDYQNIYLFLDNDTEGKKASAKLLADYSNTLDFAYIYKKHKDFNEYLINGKTQNRQHNAKN